MDKKKILVVDDEKRIRDMLNMILESRGYEVSQAENGLEAIKMVELIEPDLVIMDVMMPVMNGIDSCKEISGQYECPIIMLTAKGEDYDQVLGLESGADDYIIKPFTPMVLVARIEAILRRYHIREEEKDVFGAIRIDISGREIYIDGEAISVNKKEFELLSYFVNNPKISLSREQILESVWGYDYLGTDSTVDTTINRLRKKLGKCGSYIKTVRGYGYRFEVNND